MTFITDNSLLDFSMWSRLVLQGKIVFIVGWIVFITLIILCAEIWLLVELYGDLRDFKKYSHYQDDGKRNNNPSKKHNFFSRFISLARKFN